MEARLLESARLAAAGQLSASLARELNTPLASVVSSLEWLSESIPALLAPLQDANEPGAQAVLEALADARASAGRLAAATSHLELLGSPAQLTRHALPVAPLLEAAVAEVQRELNDAFVVERHFEAELAVLADPGRLSHALRLAVLNGASSSPAGQRKLKLEITTAANGVQIAIEAGATTIASNLAGVLKTPLPAHKPQGIGDALGLFVASRLVAELEGELVLVPRQAGTRVEIRLPRPGSQASARKTQ